MNDIINNTTTKLKRLNDIKQYNDVIEELIEKLKAINVNVGIIKKIKASSYFIVNEYSENETLKNMIDSKKKLISYLDELTYSNENLYCSNKTMTCILEKILNNFLEFKENFFEKSPHRKAGLTQIKLKELESEIKNEYDMQHILFSIIKPVFNSARTEVSEDTGFSTVRTDIYIEEISSVVEVKYSREKMTVKQLTEQIASDMVHYSCKNIYFFIYDKSKIIDDLHSFKNTYERSIDGKKIYIIVHQPKCL